MTQGALRRLAVGVGGLSVVAVLLAGLALQDIYHREADLTLEWQIVQIAFLVTLAFHAVAMWAIWRGQQS